VRTEFSFTRKVYGTVKRVIERLQELNSPIGAIVNMGGGAWGHPKFEAAALAAGVEPAFGAEFALTSGDRRPVAWVLAEDVPALNRMVTENPTDESAFAERPGLIRFAGSALSDPELFDYIDVSPRSPLAQARARDLASRTGRKLVLVSDNFCPASADLDLMRIVIDRESTGVQWLANPEELRASFSQFSDQEFAAMVRNAHEVSERIRGTRLRKAPLIQVEGDLHAECAAGKAQRLAKGHIAVWTDEYEARLQREFEQIELKQFQSYFLVVADLVRWAKQRMLVGPARGSSAGSLVCYLLGITEVDPIRHKLLFERFIDLNRTDLPDIDIDFSDTKRDELFTYLAQKYGEGKTARLGNINTFQAASVLAQISKRLAIPQSDVWAVRNVLVNYLSGDSRYGRALEDTFQGTTPGRKFVETYPKVLEFSTIEGHATHTGIHAAGVIVCNEPITNFCAVNAKENVAQIDKADSEYLGLLKIDALGLRTLGIIEDAGCVDSETLYGLTLDDPEVLDVFNKRKFAGIFQFEGPAQRSISNQMTFTSFQQLDHATALARPGPLGGGVSSIYLRRQAGAEPIAYRHPTMERYLQDTLGIVLYQEQVMQIVREIGNFSWEQTSIIRKAMSGRKGQEFFDRMRGDFVTGAKSNGLDEASALAIWNEIFTFGAWGMNRSHTVSYSIISYWCAWMKRYHALEFAAAALRSAQNDAKVLDLLRELHSEGVSYVAFDPELSESNWSVKQGRLIGGLQNVHGIGPKKADALLKKRALGAPLTVDGAQIKFTDLFPIHTAYGDWYKNPQAHGVRSGTEIVEIADLEDGKEAVIICQMVEKEQCDENEDLRAKKRGGRKMQGQSLFADLKIVDDSISSPITLRIDRFKWHSCGERIMSLAVEGKDCFLVRGVKVQNYPMFKVGKIKCLTNERMFDEVA
jgi:DNA polymerase III alpha subunit